MNYNIGGIQHKNGNFCLLKIPPQTLFSVFIFSVAAKLFYLPLTCVALIPHSRQRQVAEHKRINNKPSNRAKYGIIQDFTVLSPRERCD